MEDRAGRFLSCNKAFEAFVGQTASELLGKAPGEFYPVEAAALMSELERKVLCSGQPAAMEHSFIDKSSKSRVVLVKICPMIDSKGRNTGIISILKDISDKRELERRSRILEAAFRQSHSLGYGPLMSFITLEMLKITGSASCFFYSIDQEKREARLLLANSPLPSSIRLRSQGWLLHGAEGKSWSKEDLGLEPGIIPEKATYLLLPIIRGGVYVGLGGVFRDGHRYTPQEQDVFTDFADHSWDFVASRQLGESLLESVKRGEARDSLLGIGYLAWNTKAARFRLDGRLARCLGLTGGPGITLGEAEFEQLVHPEDSMNWSYIKSCVSEGSGRPLEVLRLRHRDGYYLRFNTAWLIEGNREAEGGMEACGILADIGDNKAMGESYEESLRDREVLLKELYHRTRNSMQLINAMLELKKEEVEDSHVREVFDDIQAKVLAISIAQEKAYQCKKLSSINLGDYLVTLAQRLRGDEPVRGGMPDFLFEVEEVSVLLDTAIPCGIMVGELVENAFHHAFVQGSRGNIGLVVGRCPDSRISIEVWDDGKGFPLGFDPRGSRKLGLRTVIGICEEQLRGSIHFSERNPGLSVQLKFHNSYVPKRT